MAEARTLRGALSVLITATLVLGGMASGIPAASAEELPQGPAVVASGDEAAPTGDQAGSASAGVGSTETKSQPGAPNEGALPPAPATKPAGEASPPSAPQKPAAEQPSEPKAPAIATSAPASLENIRNSGGNLNWGFKASWRTYLSDWASGTQTPFGGATLNADGTTRFPESTASTFDPVAGTGTIAYTGGVLWTSTAHGFSIALQNPRVDVHGDGSATVSAESSTADTAGASSVARIIVATIPAVGTPATADGKITWTGANGTFAPSLAPSGISRYSGQATDPFTFSTPAAPAQVWAPKLAVSTVDGKALASGATVYEGDEIVVRGSGFDPEAHP
ncbi:HtaA domain-containing protein, partial [Leucobacter sp. CSA2]